MQPSFEVAGVLEAHWLQLKHSGMSNSWQLRTFDALRRCRTASMGAHVDGCSACGYLRISYNSCPNRHCPKCQGAEREKWIQARTEELLPVPYFHVVFTLPDLLNRLCLYKPKILYDLLFTTTWSVLNSFGHDHKWLGAQTGMISILHTRGLNHDPASAPVLYRAGWWINKARKVETGKSEGKYLFSMKALSKVFRGRFLVALKEQLPEQIAKAFVNQLYKHIWVVYAKRPFARAKSVVEYLGRYTHKIAISNHRLTGHQNGQVSFSCKDYKHGSVKKEMTLDAMEFIRRFSMHILPQGFVRIRHFGILSSSAKEKCLPLIKEQLPDQQSPVDISNDKAGWGMYNPKQCPCCKKETMQRVMQFSRRGPPPDWRDLVMDLLEMVKGIL